MLVISRTMNHAINVLLFSFDPFVAYLHIAYVLSVFGLCIEMSSYVVYKGKVPGVYDDWKECRRQVRHFSVTFTKGTPLGRRRNLDTPAI